MRSGLPASVTSAVRVERIIGVGNLSSVESNRVNGMVKRFQNSSWNCVSTLAVADDPVSAGGMIDTEDDPFGIMWPQAAVKGKGL